MPEWGEALRIMGVGLGVVFAVMALIAVATWASGRAFVYFEARQKAREKAAREAEARSGEDAENAAREAEAETADRGQA